MIKRWILYLFTLAAFFAMWLIQQGRIAWLLLQCTLYLPVFSLAVSLIPMVLMRPAFHCPTALPMGEAVSVQILPNCPLPHPPYSAKLRLTHPFSHTVRTIREEEPLPTGHCGLISIQCRCFWVYDYLGLFRLPWLRPAPWDVRIMPRAIPMNIEKTLQQALPFGWQPKPGGGFAENHELRLYRPGDSLNQIHWKLTAKTGKLMIREAMIPRSGKIAVSIRISGSSEELDRKMGRLLWLGNYLNDRNLPFTIQAHTAAGVLHLSVQSHPELMAAMDQLLCAQPEAAATEDGSRHALWYFHIGGEPDET